MSSGTASSSTFHVNNGQIVDPNGNDFIAAGVNVMFGNNPSVSQLQQDFPGINYVRLACYNYPDIQSIENYVDTLTAKGIVVEIEDHTNSTGVNAGGGQGTIFTGSMLTQENNWYSEVATAFKSNPYVWFGTDNEPSMKDANGQNDEAGLSDWQASNYNAIRSTGNTSPIELEANAWTQDGQPVVNQGANTADYANMTNVVWDEHFYGWLTNGDANQQDDDTYLKNYIAAAQQIKSADGTIPVIISEFGNSTTGKDGPDSNGTQMVNAVLTNGVGYAAWAWAVNPGGDALESDNNGDLSDYGKQIAAGIAAAAAKRPAGASGGSTSSTPLPTASADNTVITAKATGTIIDTNGGAWSLANGVVQLNGAAAGYSANVTEIAFEKGVIWQENSAGNWWSWNGTSWSGGGSTSPVPASTPAPTPAPTKSPTPTASPNDTVILAGKSGVITDASGNTWSISNGAVNENGKAAGYSANVTQLAYVDGKVSQENSAGNWWTWNGTGWTGGGSTSPLPTTKTPDAITLSDASGTHTVTPTAAGVSVDADTFSLLSSAATKAVLGSSPTFATFTGSAGVTVTGGAGLAVLSATAGANSFTAGTGVMDVTGGSGADAYVFGANSTYLRVNDFSAAKGDTLTIAASLKAALVVSPDGAGDTTLSFGSKMIDLGHQAAAPTIAWH